MYKYDIEGSALNSGCTSAIEGGNIHQIISFLDGEENRD